MPCESPRFYLFLRRILNHRLPVRRRLMECPELPWPLEHPPALTLQHVRADRSSLLKRRKTRTPDTIGTKLARRSDLALRKPSPTRHLRNRTPILLHVQRADTDRGKGPILRRHFQPCGDFGVRT